MPFPKSTHRRGFLKRTSIVTSALSFPFVSSNNILGANQRLNVAAIGAGGKGGVDIGYCDQENVVALCDAGTRLAAGSQKKFPKARLYQDFRVMLEKEQHRIDAVTISTPDHTHAHPAHSYLLKTQSFNSIVQCYILYPVQAIADRNPFYHLV